MTVCIGAIFRWNYAAAGPPDIGFAGIAMSDRMITAGDVEYEPNQLKVALITQHVMLMIAGDYTTHSQALRPTLKQFVSSPNATPLEVARVYGSQIQSIQRKQAEDHILSPLGLNSDTFLAQQKEMSDAFVTTITAQLQDFRPADVEALIVGIEADGNGNIYIVDSRGSVTSYSDVGFAAIGIGAWHARSRMMQAGFTNQLNFYPALASVFAAKKASEVAPGVGKSTDIHLIFRNGVEKLLPAWHDKLTTLYERVEADQKTLEASAITELEAFINDPKNRPPSSTGQISTGVGSQTGGGTSRQGTGPGADDETTAA
jgi:hypothetical protein